MVRRVEGTGSVCGLHHHQHRSQSSNQAIAIQETLGSRPDTTRRLCDHGPFSGNAGKHSEILRWIETIEPTGYDRERGDTPLEGCLVCRSINAGCPARNHTSLPQNLLGHQRSRGTDSRRAGVATTHDADPSGDRVKQLRIPQDPEAQRLVVS
jgi:hypothetical protein